MTRAILLGLIFAVSLMPSSAFASDPAARVRFCSEETFDYRGKFEQLLTAAFERDFRAFRSINTVNGTSEIDSPTRVVTFNDGEEWHGEAFAAFAGFQAQDQKMPVIDNWVLLNEAQPNPSHGYKLFYTAITRWIWNDYANEFQVRKSHWLAHYYDGCTLKLLQETDVPNWLGDKKEETQ